MEPLLAALRAAAEPTRLRILALAGRGALLRVGVHRDTRPEPAPHLPPPEAAVRGRAAGPGAGRRQRVVRGADGARPARSPASSWPACPATTRCWRPIAATARGCWPSGPASPRKASSARAPTGTRCARWTCRPPAVEASLLTLVPESSGGRLLDIGTGTGRVLELLGPRVDEGLGVDASRAMLALARSRLARAGLAHCSVRLADMYRMPLRGRLVRYRGAADGAAPRGRPGARARPRRRGCCAPAAG